MSPLAIRIALHYYYSPEDFPEDAPAQRDIIAGFVRDGILVDGYGRNFDLTDRGHAYVEQLMAVPLPT